VIDGLVLKIGEQEFIVPAVNFKGVKRIEKLLKKLCDIPAKGGVLNIDQVDIITEIVLIGLQRNYPDLTKDQLEGILDFNNIQRVLEAVTGQAGFKSEIIYNPKRQKSDEQPEEEFVRKFTESGKIMGNT
jgi:hypothetical protein